MAEKNSLLYKAKQHKAFDEKDEIKNRFIIKDIKTYINNHIAAINELPKQKWQYEQQFTFWTKEINIYFNGYIDLLGETHFVDLKNVFGTVKFKPLKKIKKKNYKLNENRFGDYVCSNKSVPEKPFHSDLMQMALYKKMCGKIPALIYVSSQNYKCFTPDNCYELKDKNLEIHFKELIAIQLTWQNKLQYAMGDIGKLAGIIKPDFSNIRKKDFWWETVPVEYIKRFKKVYGCN